jgi:hypothetical protein
MYLRRAISTNKQKNAYVHCYNGHSNNLATEDDSRKLYYKEFIRKCTHAIWKSSSRRRKTVKSKGYIENKYLQYQVSFIQEKNSKLIKKKC